MVKHFPYGSQCRLEATPGLAAPTCYRTETRPPRGWTGLVDPHSGKLLGGVNLGIEGGEIMVMVQLATMKNPP
jgi:hypothetical protein